MNYQLVEDKLNNKLGELEERLSHVKRDVSKSHSTDSSEQAQERENDEVLEEIGRETDLAIREIRLALERIHNGTYGQCSDCGEAINPARLDAIPETVHCVSCASK
ncbi:MAG: TraR/DksA family transcriptional regulator [Oceanicoccus sp.]